MQFGMKERCHKDMVLFVEHFIQLKCIMSPEKGCSYKKRKEGSSHRKLLNTTTVD